MSRSSQLEEQFAMYVRLWELPTPVPEHKFHPKRRWRFDFAWPEHMVAVEIEGGVWNNGRHNRASGFIADCDKYNAAALLGWRVLRYTSQHLDNPHAVIAEVRQALGVEHDYQH